MNLRIGTRKGIALAQLGTMLEYPDDYYVDRIEQQCASIVAVCPETTKSLASFVLALRGRTVGELEELFTRTFDLAAICSPYITGYIFGDENFDRGTLMATLGEKYQEMGFEPGLELPDHLGVLLKFAGWLDEEALEELIQFVLVGPVEQMCERLDDSQNAFSFYLTAVLNALKCDLKQGDRR